MADELARAITKIIFPVLKPKGFYRDRKRDLIRVDNGIVQRLYFQVTSRGGRDFCVTACANIIASNAFVSLAPGFRLTRETGGGLWLPSRTAEEAERSASVILGSILAEALPYFENIRTIRGFSALLAEERWGSTHHLKFERGVSAAMEGNVPAARQHLVDAIRLYRADGRDWCVGYILRAEELLDALRDGTSKRLLETWELANGAAHGVR